MFWKKISVSMGLFEKDIFCTKLCQIHKKQYSNFGIIKKNHWNFDLSRKKICTFFLRNYCHKHRKKIAV